MTHPPPPLRILTRVCNLAVLALVALSAAPAGAASVLTSSAAEPLARLAERAAVAPEGTLWRMTDLEVPGIGPAELVLERFELFTADLRYLVDGDERPAPADLRQMTFWRGVVADHPNSGAFVLVAPRGSAQGFLRLGEARYVLSPSAAGTLTAAIGASATLDPSVPSCGAQGALERPGGLGRVLAERASLGNEAKKPKPPKLPIPAPPGLFTAPIAVETDAQMLNNQFGDVGRVHQLIGGLFGEISAVSDRELGMALAVNLISVWTDDPWSDTGDGLTLLQELKAFWNKNRPYSKYPRSAVHLVSGRGLNVGGIAWVYGACDGRSPDAYDFGLSRTNALTIAHELGHTFGSFHTHCYEPPVDLCYAQQEGCYAGPAQEPPDGGSLMSYCENRNASYGEPGKYGTNSERVLGALRGFINEIYPSCLVRRSDPFELTATAITANSATLSWKDVFTGEKNWVVEVKNKNTYKLVKSLSANATSFTVTKLKPGATYLYRVYAKFKTNESEKSFTVSVTPG